MGCDFFYAGVLPDNSLQIKVINLVISYYHEIALYINPRPETEYITKRGGEAAQSYPFNYFGVVPLFANELFEQGQFVFDRSDGGKLIRFEQLPPAFDIPPWSGRYDSHAELVLREGGWLRAGGGYPFAFLLNLIKIRWWPESIIGDDYNNCLDVGHKINEWGLSDLKKKNLDFNASWDLFCRESNKRHPVRQRSKPVIKTEPEHLPKLKPAIRVVHPNPERITLEELDLSIRAYRCLIAGGIKTLGDLVQCSDHDLRRLTGWRLSRTDLDAIKEILIEYGYRLRPD
ncbi:MAG: DNA-directed RNA polymerase subunit alpha C-terminal domain-containing protein [Bacillota bacterium]|nr:DNA-directed RNA polymerase subunit alpha C-terminal domain-containing protein [Bacillota bacterium]MDW7685003.1 DNA-directed RNA polymerase subunit alpha C-terminal domain-containing protein [Bacillota bacterium]